MMSMLISTVLFFSCNNATKITETGEEDSFEPCSATIESTYPLPNSAEMYYRDHVSAVFSEEITAATITLQDANGNKIEGNEVFSDTQLTFFPNEPLQPSSQYSASIDYCGSEEQVNIDFRTTDLGTPLSNGNSDLINKTYAVDLESGVVLEPAGVGELLRSFLSNTFLIHVEEANESSISVLSALSMADSMEQNFCVATLNDFPLVDLSASPFFSLDAETLQLNVSAYNVRIYNFRVNGTFASDASRFEQAYIEGEFDAREAYTLLADFGFAAENGDDVCSLLENVGAACIECSSDSAPYCLRIVIDDLIANSIDEDITPICESNCHVQCEDNLETCDQPQEEQETTCD